MTLRAFIFCLLAAMATCSSKEPVSHCLKQVSYLCAPPTSPAPPILTFCSILSGELGFHRGAWEGREADPEAAVPSAFTGLHVPVLSSPFSTEGFLGQGQM